MGEKQETGRESWISSRSSLRWAQKHQLLATYTRDIYTFNDEKQPFCDEVMPKNPVRECQRGKLIP